MFPKRLEDIMIATHGYFHSENSALRYGEDLFVALSTRGITPQFAFGQAVCQAQFAMHS
ncbi:hypothetical protein OG21DRAFT_1570723 [Imleria badia]|nr:hypothetical protein OG21DRAFT_1570723 [Imleria badia]